MMVEPKRHPNVACGDGASKPRKAINVEGSGRSIGDRPMASNHIFGRGTLTAIATLVVATLLSAVPVYAEDQQPSAVQLKAHAQNAVKIISGDKQKIEAYCEFADLTDKFDQAVEEEDTKKAEELFQKGEELQRKLGPEFAAVADGVKNCDA